jgi:hypothetical protein
VTFTRELAAQERLVVVLFEGEDAWTGMCDFAQLNTAAGFPASFEFATMPAGMYTVGALLVSPEYSDFHNLAGSTVASGLNPESFDLTAGGEVSTSVDLLDGVTPEELVE